MIFDSMDFSGHEQVVFVSDVGSGLQAIIAIHNTARGPGLGGCRIRSYSSEKSAAVDVLRLSEGMTWKAALADLPLGGGKSVVMLRDGRPKSPEMMRAMGRAIERLAGRYIAAEDVGATPADMDQIGETTAHVTGRSSDVGDPAPWTAEGVFLSLEAAAAHRLGASDLKGVRVTVKGLGAVGGRLAKRLSEAGAVLTIADIDAERTGRMAEELGAEIVAPEAALATSADVYAPCALGGEFTRETIARLGAKVVCGAANNQLATAEDGRRLADAGVLYCPDYLVNAGGLISVARPAIDMDEPAALKKLRAIPGTLKSVIEQAEAEGEPTSLIADRLARERVEGASGTK